MNKKQVLIALLPFFFVSPVYAKVFTGTKAYSNVSAFSSLSKGYTASGWTKSGSSYTAYAKTSGGSLSGAGTAVGKYTGGRIGLQVSSKALLSGAWALIKKGYPPVRTAYELYSMYILTEGILRRFGYIDDGNGNYRQVSEKSWVLFFSSKGNYPGGSIDNEYADYRDFCAQYGCTDIEFTDDLTVRNRDIKCYEQQLISPNYEPNGCWYEIGGADSSGPCVIGRSSGTINGVRCDMERDWKKDLGFPGKENVLMATNPDKYITLTEAEFNRIMQSVIDSNPTPWINAIMRDSDGDYNSNVKVGDFYIPNRTISSDPYTDPLTGEVKQAVYNIDIDDSTGAVKNITTNIINRSDIEPNSEQAPVLEKPKTETQPKTETETQEDSKTKEETPTDYGDYEVEEITLPKKTIDVSFTPDLFLPQDGVCPEPKNFTVMGKTYQLSWNPLCDFARNIRPLILLCFIVAASYICMSAVKNNN